MLSFDFVDIRQIKSGDIVRCVMMAMAMEPLRTAPLVTSRLEMSGDSEEEERVMTEPHIVVEWLTFLQLGQYSRGFIENGYDDLETVKKIGPADLDAIGVMSAHHRAFLLDAVRVLKEQASHDSVLYSEKNIQ